MRRFALGAIAGLCLLAGCTTDLPRPNATVNVGAITYAILTELYCASIELPGVAGNPSIASGDNWVAEIDMNLSAQIEASANPVVSLLGPFNLARAVPGGGTVGSFTAAFSGGVDQTRTNLREYKIYINLKTLTKGDAATKVPNWQQFAEAHNWLVNCDNPNAGGTYLQGRLGIKDWLAPAIATQEDTILFAPLNAPPAAPVAAPTPAPTITDVFPSSGPAGTPINITGANLSPTLSVTFNCREENSCNASRAATILSSSTPTNLVVKPPPGFGAGTVDVVVQTKAGYATSQFTYTATHNLRADTKVASTGGSQGGQATGSQQSPSIGGTFTFNIKATATFGPSFVLSRVSGGASNLFSVIRTDDNYVIFALTPATYCPIIPGSPAGVKAGCPTAGGGGQPPSTSDLSAAFYRLDSTITNLSITKIVVSP